MAQAGTFGRSKLRPPTLSSVVVGIVVVLLTSLSIVQAVRICSSMSPTVNVPINTSGNAVSQVVITDGSGGAIVVWTTAYPNGDVYAQRVDSTGELKWAANGVAVCTAAGHQGGAVATGDGSGGAIISWHDYRDGSFENDYIYAQRVDGAGLTRWADNGIPICTADGHKLSSGITGDGSGGAVVAWENQHSGSDSDVYAQRVTAGGSTGWTDNGVPVCAAVGFQSCPAVVGDGAAAIITWQDSGRGGIYAQRVSSLGTAEWAHDGVPVCTAAGSQMAVRAERNEQGGAIIAWQDSRSGEYRAYAQRVDQTGASLWSDNGVAVCTAPGRQEQPVITGTGSGGAIITWEDRRYGNADCFAQKIDSTGARQWSADGVPICKDTADQWCIRVVGDGSGGAIIAWEDRRYGDDAVDIYAQMVNADGAPQWADNGSAVCSATSLQFSPAMADDGHGGAIIAWQDRRNGGTNDIYAQRIGASGYLGWRPRTPANLSPANLAVGVSLMPMLQSSEFTDVDAEDTHGSSQWQITALPGDYSIPAFDSQADDVNLISISVPSETLACSTSYFWRVRYRDNHGDWSAWSAETSFNTINRPPDQPSNAAPVGGTTGVSLTPTLQSSAFSDPDAGDAHGASQWLVTASAGDYSTPLFDSGADTVNLLQVAVPSGELNVNTTYHWHVRHQDNHGDWSDWSAETSFSTICAANQVPNQPANALPSDGATGVSTTPTLQSSGFSDTLGDTHAASQWQITMLAGNYSNTAFDSQTDNLNLVNIQVPAGRLGHETTYYWRMRHQDNHGEWSDWSVETSFGTAVAPNQPPGRPSNGSPTDGASGISPTPVLDSSVFSDPDTGDTHAASQWRISTTSSDYSNPVFDSDADSANLIELTVPSGTLKSNTTYYWQVRHQDNHGDWSGWSTEFTFTTAEESSPKPQHDSKTWIWITVAVAAVAIPAGGIGIWRVHSTRNGGAAKP